MNSIHRAVSQKIRASLSLFLAVLLLSSAGFFMSCSGASPEQCRIVTTVYPVYDWVLQILGEKADTYGVTYLCDRVSDLHSYQPSPADIATIAKADLFLLIGGASDAWSEKVLSGNHNESRKTVALIDTVDAKEEEALPGIDEGHDEAHDGELDEHIWLSLRNAERSVRAIESALKKLYPTDSAFFAGNANAYVARLNALDREYRTAVEGAARKTILVADRFPFRYLCEDYGISYYAAFPGCSSESNASIGTICFLSDRLLEENLPVVLITEGSDGAVARTVIKTAGSNAQIVALSSCQSVSRADLESGRVLSYLSEMEKNLGVLRQALGAK